MKIANDVFNLFVAQAALKGRHYARASSEDRGTNRSIGSGRAARKAVLPKNSRQVRRILGEVQTSSVMAAAAMQFKELFSVCDCALSFSSSFIATG